MTRPALTLVLPGVASAVCLWLCRPNLLFDGHPVFSVLGVAYLVLVAHRSLPAAGAVLLASHGGVLVWVVTSMWGAMGPGAAMLAWTIVTVFATAFNWLAIVIARWSVRRGIAWAIVLPPTWTLLEVLRAELPYGFDWPSLGYSGAGTSLGGLLGFTGVHGVSGLLIGLGCLVGPVYSGYPEKLGAVHFRSAAIVGVLLGSAAIVAPDFPAHSPGLHLRVALIQAGDGDLSWAEQVSDEILTEADVVVGAEGLLKGPSVVPFRGSPLIAGAGCPPRVACRANRVEYHDADGNLVSARNKSVLVPGYEIGLLDGLWVPPVPMEPISIAGTTAAAAICYEIVHSATLRALMAGGAQLLLNPTSDLWQDSDLAARQQKAIAAARAAELGIYVIRVSNRYHSSVFSPTGAEVFSSGPIDEERVFVLSIAPTAPHTLRGNFPLVMELVLVGLSLAGVLACLVLARRKARGGRCGGAGLVVQPGAYDAALPPSTKGQNQSRPGAGEQASTSGVPKD